MSLSHSKTSITIEYHNRIECLMGQCLARRILDYNKVQMKVKAWQEARNNKNAKINWQFKTEDARVKMKRLYPLCDD